jgi:hypothetical protein
MKVQQDPGRSANHMLTKCSKSIQHLPALFGTALTIDDPDRLVAIDTESSQSQARRLRPSNMKGFEVQMNGERNIS